MSKWISRVVAIVVVGMLWALETAAHDRHQLAWLDSTSADQVVAHQRHLYSHGYAFQASATIVMLGIAVIVVELLALFIRRLVNGRTPPSLMPAHA